MLAYPRLHVHARFTTKVPQRYDDPSCPALALIQRMLNAKHSHLQVSFNRPDMRWELPIIYLVSSVMFEITVMLLFMPWRASYFWIYQRFVFFFRPLSSWAFSKTRSISPWIKCLQQLLVSLKALQMVP